ncbi:MAG: RsmB/NOP family class I SAM-dependent RNA methyltransferase [Clostridium sp.]|nr:RsmB/NOP family class I SAM-dependent RNA methyltransferase [Clostridium sp.]MCM1444632.1 RsmB/NOP family class I SAM-dependent RNA methyltransferase [Candidatus Amulumruptor caecigallinarius]
MIQDFLHSKLIDEYGESVTNNIIEGYLKERPITFRVNVSKISVDKVKGILNKKNIDFEEVSWYKDAFIIKNTEKSRIEKLDIYKNGEIYLQSLSSMLPVLSLKVNEGESVLDMAASPGGKTTQLYCLYKNIRITAIEKDKIRFERLKYNIEKQGITSISVLNMDSLNLDDLMKFDNILLDAPCSGSGKIQKSAKLFLNDKVLNNFSILQEKLLRKALKILKPGSEMIYSTCSILKEENENVIDRVIKDFDVSVISLEKELEFVPKLPTTIKGVICVCPDDLFEGFFVAKLRKNS